MSETLLSVGLDVGTTSTQMILSQLQVENQASAFAVPEMEITQRKILYKSPVHFTPLRDESHVDADKLRALVASEYEAAGIRREQVDTGAVIITGETSRKENARIVLESLSDFAGDFVVATAGPDLESQLAAKGAGAVDFSEKMGKTVLHMDIGGGTSNLALIEDGRIVKTGCLNVGGRLLKFGEMGEISYISPVLQGICTLKVGDKPTQAQLRQVADMLVQALEMAAGLRERTPLLEHLITAEAAGGDDYPMSAQVISFSGGVADCIEKEHPDLAFGDMGPVLGRAIRGSALCHGAYRLGTETIRATVIGAGCHSAQLSGSTVYHRGITFPLKNKPVVTLTAKEQDLPASKVSDLIVRQMAAHDEPGVLALPGYESASYDQVVRLADIIAGAVKTGQILVALEADCAKALGHAIALRSGLSCLCIDRVRLTEGSFLDVGAPVGPALPVVVKTLILHRG